MSGPLLPLARRAGWLLGALVAAALAAPPAAAQQTDAAAASLADLNEFETFLQSWRVGGFRLVREGETDLDAVAKVESLAANLARWNNLAAAQKLFEAAATTPEQAGDPSATQRIEFFRETQPWRVHAILRRHLAAMDAPEVEDFLVARVNVAGRDFRKQPAAERMAAMRTLGERGSLRGLVTILDACRRFPNDERVRAINVLSRHAVLDTAPSFLGLLDDREPNARIAALNGLAKSLAAHTDETAHASVPEQVVTLRDAAIAAIRPMLLRDKVWQVRAAAREALVALRSKHVIPVLIEGLEAELKRTKDPWSLDVRLHDALERMTGLDVPQGQAKAWREFWRREGTAFEYERAQAEGAQRLAARSAADARYHSFFKLSLDSDRILFVVDVSGSMNEPARLGDTDAGGVTTTKHELVVGELRKIVMTIPDGGYFNLVVFNDEVKVWRPDERGRPAMVKMDDESRDDLLASFIDRLRPSGPTNLHGALDVALDFAGSGIWDKYYDVGFDTMYVLSDGAPSYGAVTDRDEIVRLVTEANSLRRLTINCITFGDQNETEFLRKLAEQNGGRHVHVQ